MSEEAPTAYDTVSYPGSPFSQTHPDRLATIAALYGLPAAPPERCRVLELGCGNGGNLIPMAYVLPGSTFLGLDAAGSAVAQGREQIAALGLTNVTLLHVDLLDAADLGTLRLRHRARPLLVGAAGRAGAGARDRLRSARSERRRVRELQRASRMPRPKCDAPDDALARAGHRGTRREDQPGAEPRPVSRGGWRRRVRSFPRS